jgi:hypothetical protein
MGASNKRNRARAQLRDITDALGAIEGGQRRFETSVIGQLQHIEERLGQLQHIEERLEQLHQASYDSPVNTIPSGEDDDDENDGPATTRDIMRPLSVDKDGHITRTSVERRHIMDLICRSPVVRSKASRLNFYSMLTEETRRQLTRIQVTMGAGHGECTVPWSAVPERARRRAYRCLEKFATRWQVPLSRCVGSWAAYHLVSERWINAYSHQRRVSSTSVILR